MWVGFSRLRALSARVLNRVNDVLGYEKLDEAATCVTLQKTHELSAEHDVSN
jgi:hypothetical protein